MRTMIGVDSTGAGCVKIMKSIFDDPRITPDSEKHKFLYNSKWDSQIRVHDIERIEYRGAGSGRQYDPPGSNDDTYSRLIMEGNGVPETSYSFRKSFFPNLAYTMPLIDVKWRRPSDGRYVQNQVRKQDGPGVYGYGGYWSTGGSEERGWGENMAGIRGTLNYGTVITLNMRSFGPYMDLGMEKRLIVWNLPGDQTPIADAKALAPVSGQMAVQITPHYCRVAKPGYDVRNASGTQLAFDSSNRPAKVIAAGDIDIPNGVSYHNTGIALPANVVADIHFYDAGGPVYYPANPGNLGKGAEYWFEGTHIGFYNPNAACRGRFLVLAEDDTPMTAGSNRVFRETVENGRTAVQFLRPGAGPNPSFADIIVDSRWPAIQLLAEGTLTVGGGAQTQTVNFAGGFFPFVKYMTIHGGYSGNSGINYSRRIRMPFVKTLQDAGSYGAAPAGDSSYVILTGNQAIFHTFVGNPVNRYFTSSSNYPRAITNDYDRTPIIAIRYFIFGIPSA